MINTEIKDATNHLLTLLEKYNTPGFILIPEPNNVLYGEIAFKNNKLHDYLRDMLTSAAMKDQYERIARMQDDRALIEALKAYTDVDVKFTEHVKDVFSKAGISSKYTDSILAKALKKDDKIDRSLNSRRNKISGLDA